jgi:hypothetical protein
MCVYVCVCVIFGPIMEGLQCVFVERTAKDSRTQVRVCVCVCVCVCVHPPL